MIARFNNRAHPLITRIAAALLCLSAIAPASQAIQYTFEFSFANWQFNDSPAMLGTSASALVTVDNGGSIVNGQLFDLADIVHVRMSAVGGTFVGDFSSSSLQGPIDLTLFYTDAAGTPYINFNLPMGQDEPLVGFVGGTFFQIGMGDNTGSGFSPISMGYPTIRASANGNLQAVDLPGRLVSTAVPDGGATAALLGLGIASLAFARRKLS